MKTMKRIRPLDDHGILLIGSYLLLSMFLVYSSAMTLRMNTQRMAADRLADRLQAIDLARGAMEQFREDFYVYLTSEVYAVRKSNNALATMQWLDDLGTLAAGGTLDTALNPPLSDFSAKMSNVTGVTTGGGGSSNDPRVITLPSGNGSAWVASVVNTDPGDILAPRRLTIEATATVGGVTKRVRAIYEISLGASSIFQYAYFVNNYGWFDISGSNRIYLRGEARANGDLAFTGSTSRIYVDGDLYASKNAELINPKTGKAAAGTITGDPNQTSSQSSYWNSCTSDPCNYHAGRPTLNVTFPNQPAIGGTLKTLKSGYGWDSDNPQQVRNEAQATQPIPYLGDLSLYKTLATQKNSTLTYYDQKTKQTKTVAQVYYGPDGVPNTSDDNDPIILVGTSSRPIKLNGPVVIPGDVIIKGVVSGRGTIYAGRNVHVVGETKYKNPPHWRRLERNKVTGRIARRGNGRGSSSESNLGTVCKNGSYYQKGASLPGGCMQ